MPDFRLLAAVLVAGVVVPGVADYVLSRAGFGIAGAAVWLLGYGTAILVVYFGWLRHLDFGAAG